MKRTTKTARDRGDWQGMNWIRQTTRLAIYLRDGMACAYCGASIESGAIFTLDHVRPHSHGGGNEATNLVTCCKRCNSARGNRGLRAWTRAVAEYINHGATAGEIESHVRNCTRRDMKAARREANELIARRGSVARVLASK